MATTRPLEDREIKKLFDAISGRHEERNRTMLTLGIAGALRATELVSLLIGDVYDGKEVRNYIRIRGETAKFGKERIIRIGEEIRHEVADYLQWRAEAGQSLQESRPLFVSQKGGQLTRQMLHVILKNILAEAGIDQSPHALRKTGAMIYYQQSEYDIEATRQHLGHADLTTTRKYLGLETHKIVEYSERTAKHLKAAITRGERAKFDTMLHMSNFRLESAPTATLIGELARRGLDVDDLVQQMADSQIEMARTAGDAKVIPFPVHRNK